MVAGKKQILRLSVDTAMLILLFVVMSYDVTGNTLHEWIGIALMCLFVIHIALNFAWARQVVKGRYGFRRILGTTINILLLTSLIMTLAASLPISSEVFPWFRLFATEAFPVQIHIAAGNWMFILVAMHFGTQWHRVRIYLPCTSKSVSTAIGMVVIAVACYGVWALWQRNLLPKLVMYYSFDFWRGNVSVMRFVADYISIFAFFAVIAYHIVGIKNRRQRQ